jgi:hypothetical protein
MADIEVMKVGGKNGDFMAYSYDESKIIQYINLGDAASTSKIFIKYRIISPTLNPDEISKNLNLKPTKAWRQGDFYIGKMLCNTTNTVVEVERQRATGLWLLSSENMINSLFLEDHATYLLELLEPNADILIKYINFNKYSVKFHIWWECKDAHGGIQLSSDILNRISKICEGIDSSFLFMPHDSTETD